MVDDGRYSEWNEATLKVIRLHEIQSTINLLKLNPLGRTEDKFNYFLLANSIRLLYGEGYSKYNDSERKKVDAIEEMVFNCIKYLPPHIPDYNDSLSGRKVDYILNQDNFERLMNLIELFEREVKDYNDKHGLTTKNRTTEGLF